jgi:hypothetical protein
MSNPKLISIAVSLALSGFLNIGYAQDVEEEPPAQERPNPEERSFPSSMPGGIGTKARDVNPVDPVASPGLKMQKIDPSSPVVSPGDKLHTIDPSAPVVRKGTAPVHINQPNFDNPATMGNFNPQPEPPARVYKLQDGTRLQLVKTPRGQQAYILRGNQRMPAKDGIYHVKGGKDVSVKMGLVIEDRTAAGMKSPASKGTEKMGLIIEDRPTPGMKGPASKGTEKMGIVVEERPTPAMKGPTGKGTEKMGIIIEDKSPKQQMKALPAKPNAAIPLGEKPLKSK